MNPKKFWEWGNVTNEAGEESRELRLEGVIAEESWFDDEITPQMFRDELMAGEGDITLHISSPGGDCIAASRIYTMLMDYPGRVYVQIDGLAASAASVIAMAGSRVLMSPTALMMIHNPMTVAAGDEADMKAAIDLLREVKESIMNAYNVKTGLPYDKLAALMDKETWMDAKRAVKLGFADGILHADADEDEDEERPEDADEDEDEERPEDADADEEEEDEERPEDLRRALVAMADRLAVSALVNKVRAHASPAAAERTGRRRAHKAAAPILDNRLTARQEAEQRERVVAQYHREHTEEKKAMNLKNARGAYLKSAITRMPVAPEVRDALTIQTGVNPGNGLLPIEVSRSLITDIYGEDRFLSQLTHTQIKGLRLPGVAATTAADAVRAADGSTEAGETVLTDSVINFGRFPGREKIVVPSAILRGTETDLDSYITGRLTYDHRRNMRARIFAAASATGDLAHMSVYTKGTGNPGIAEEKGSDVLNAVQKAIAALPEGVRDSAKVVMTYAQWMELIETLANGATALFGAPTKELLGFEVITSDYVKDAGILVGDLATIHINYDDPLWLKTDEDIDLDMTKIVIGYDYDIRIEDKNRLRLAKVSA